MSEPAGDRTGALAAIVALAREHRISAREIADALGAPGDIVTPGAAGDGRWRGVLVRALGYLGGTFVFAGIGIFVALQWDVLNSASRVVVTLGSGFAALALALIAVRDVRFDKATPGLFLIAAALEPTGMLVSFHEYGAGGDWRWANLITCGAMAVQFAGVFAAVRRSTVLFVTVLFGILFWLTAFDLLDVDNGVMALVIGSTLMLTAIGVDRTSHRNLTPAWYFFGAIGCLYGYFDLVEDAPVEVTFVAVAAVFVYLAAALHSRTLLFVATIALLAYTGYYTGEHFAESIGWPMALIGFGMLMIALSALAFRIDRDYVRRFPTR